MIDLNSRELRIGNFVKMSYGSIARVIQLDNCIKVTGNSTHFTNGVYGIPLTEDWVLKLGFKLSGSWYEIRSDSVEFSIYLPDMKASMCEFNKEQDSIYFPIPNNSVHWLQNWYYVITGQELQLTP